MQVISIRWKDSDDKVYKDIKYRKKTIKRYKSGWIFDGDYNVYHCIECAENSIDKILGSPTRKNADARHSHGIHIIGKRVDA